MKLIKITKDKENLIRHTLMHLEGNKIHINPSDGWYCGSRDQFVKRHIEAIKFLKTMLDEDK